MNLKPVLLSVSFLMLISCVSSDHRTIADLHDIEVEVKNVKIEGGVEKAMQSYQKFLEQTPDTSVTPEAIRRLADLNIEREYGVIETSDKPDLKVADITTSEAKVSELSETDTAALQLPKSDPEKENINVIASVDDESNKNFEKRATQQQKLGSDKAIKQAVMPDGTSLEDLQTAGAKKAIALYLKLLKKFPLYERNDQVLYQLSRAYEETGEVEKAMQVMNRMIKEYPYSRHFAEVQFRRAEYFFTRKKLLDAEDAYKSLLAKGKGTGFYALALYKLGWSFYKQELYEDALIQFVGLLDHKLSIGYDFKQSHNKAEKKRIEDTYRVISLSFSNLGGASSVIDFFKKIGPKSYESDVYSHLAEFYLKKRRYSDAAKTYNAYIDNNPFNKVSPHFSMRVIDIYHKGLFPGLVIEAKKKYASTYGLTAEYWKYFDPKQHTDVVDYLKKNIIDLANYYHAAYQDIRQRRKKKTSFKQASHWYKEFLLSFPKDTLSSGINYQLADLFLENRDFLSAAIEYEKTAYQYALNEKSSKAGYAAVSTYRQHLSKVKEFERNRIKREVIRASLRFVDVFPKHKKADIILSAAADDLYDLKDFQIAINTSHQLINNYPQTDILLKRSSWLVIAYSSFDLRKYSDAETAFINVLAIKDKKINRKKRKELEENLAAAIYKQGEQAVKLLDHRAAADHFLRVSKLVPGSKIRSTSEYDAATALIQLKAWSEAADVLNAFRKSYPKNKLQPEITKKLAFIYKQDKKFAKAASEFERIFKETSDRAIRRESLLIAAELYEKIPDKDNELRLYKRFLKFFPKPIGEVLEIHNKIAVIYDLKKDNKNYIKTLKRIIKVDAKAGKARNDRTRYLAGMASLAIIEPLFGKFSAIKLKRPFKRNLKKKRKQMKANIKRYNRLVDYRVGNVTAAATYYIAETYYEFSQSLMKSERPKKLTELELEQYDEILEEQAYPFEEKGINIHKKNIELLSVGVYSQWIDKSLAKLGKLVPGRYAKYETSTGALDSMLSYTYIVEKIPAPVKATEPVINEADTSVSLITPGVTEK